MRIARIQCGSDVGHAVVHDEAYEWIDGDLFGDWQPSGRKTPADRARLLAPVQPRQVVGIGLNYTQHAHECNLPLPEAPVIFLKACSSVVGPNDPILLPKVAPDEVDYEAELVIVIGKPARHVHPEQAGEYILGYTCGNDVSARDCQLRLDAQWARGKSFDTFAPLGPWIQTDAPGDALDIRLTLNDQIMQDSNTSDLIFNGASLLSSVSACMTLYPGSVIMTGTPSGVGMGRMPPVFLADGDVVTVEIEGIGRLTNPVHKEV